MFRRNSGKCVPGWLKYSRCISIRENVKKTKRANRVRPGTELESGSTSPGICLERILEELRNDIRYRLDFPVVVEDLAPWLLPDRPGASCYTVRPAGSTT